MRKKITDIAMLYHDGAVGNFHLGSLREGTDERLTAITAEGPEVTLFYYKDKHGSCAREIRYYGVPYEARI